MTDNTNDLSVQEPELNNNNNNNQETQLAQEVQAKYDDPVQVSDPVPDQALRYNQGKVQYSLIDLTCLKYTAQVLQFGAVKYARDNWRKGMPTSQILDSLLRHIAAIQNGEVIDPESGLPHIGHIGCNVMFLGNPNNTQDIQVLPEDQALQ